MQRPHERRERNVAVGQRVEVRGTHPIDELREFQRGIARDTQHGRVGEEPDEAVELGAAAPGEGCADDDVGLSPMAREQHGEHRVHHREERRAERCGERLQLRIVEHRARRFERACVLVVGAQRGGERPELSVLARDLAQALRIAEHLGAREEMLELLMALGELVEFAADAGLHGVNYRGCAKSRRPRESGDPVPRRRTKALGPRFRGDDDRGSYDSRSAGGAGSLSCARMPPPAPYSLIANGRRGKRA